MTAPARRTRDTRGARHTRHSRLAYAAALTAACAALLLACKTQDDDDAFLPIDRAEHPLAGLYAPGSTLGYVEVATASDASTGGLSAEEQRAIEDSIAAADKEDRCAPPLAESGTPGALAITFTSDTYGGFYEPANCGAVWIEDEKGHYIATADVWAKMRLRNIFIWQGRRCKTDEPDVVSSATLETHEKHEITWDGHDLSGGIAPDGPYVLNIEVTEDELNYGRRAQFPFEKAPKAATSKPSNTECVRGLVMTWMPGAEAVP